MCIYMENWYLHVAHKMLDIIHFKCLVVRHSGQIYVNETLKGFNAALKYILGIPETIGMYNVHVQS